MKLNKILKDETAYNTYFRSMYGSQWYPKKEEEKKPEDNPAISKYLDEVDSTINSKLARDYKKAVSDFNACPESDTTKKKELEKKVDGIEDRLQNQLNRHEQSLNRVARQLAKEHGLIYSFERLTKEILSESTDLLADEKSLIFGDTLEKINDVLMMEETSKSTKLNRIRIANQALADAKTPSEKQAAALIVSQQKEELADSEKTDALTGEKLKEETDPVVLAKEKSLNSLETKNDKVKENNDKEEDNLQKQIEKKREEVAKAKELSNDGKKVVNDAENLSEDFARISPDLRSEKTVSKDLRGEKKVTKDLRDEKSISKKDTSKYDTMLFNGASGEVLKFMIKNEINNNNRDVLEISKLAKEDPEAQVVLKKINALLKKASKKELSYEEYTQLKVLKSQFKSIFTKLKNKYDNRYKN